jgi:hypothetical protein
MDTFAPPLPMTALRPLRGPAPLLMIELDPSLVLAFRKQAAARDVPIKRLIHDLLDTIGEEPGLVGAILDHDGGDVAGIARRF